MSLKTAAAAAAAAATAATTAATPGPLHADESPAKNSTLETGRNKELEETAVAQSGLSQEPAAVVSHAALNVQLSRDCGEVQNHPDKSEEGLVGHPGKVGGKHLVSHEGQGQFVGVDHMEVEVDGLSRSRAEEEASGHAEVHLQLCDPEEGSAVRHDARGVVHSEVQPEAVCEGPPVRSKRLPELDPAALEAAQKLLEEVVYGTEGWLLQALERLMVSVSRSVQRLKCEEDRMEAVRKLTVDVRALLLQGQGQGQKSDLDVL